MKLFELRPPAAVLMHSPRSPTNRLKPNPHPDVSVTVESPTSTMRTFRSGVVGPFSARSVQTLSSATQARIAHTQPRVRTPRGSVIVEAAAALWLLEKFAFMQKLAAITGKSVA